MTNSIIIGMSIIWVLIIIHLAVVKPDHEPTIHIEGWNENEWEPFNMREDIVLPLFKSRQPACSNN